MKMWGLVSCVLLAVLKLASSQVGGGIYDCPSPWLQFSDKCYKFVLIQDTLSNAGDVCAIDGAALVSVNTREENEFIANWLAVNELQNRMWYTSGRRTRDTEFAWAGDGTRVEGAQFWLDEEARRKSGDQILYATYGQKWGWMIGPTRNITVDIARPYICEISRSEVYRIVEGDKDYSYGTTETDESKIARGVSFVRQPTNVLYDKTGNYKYLTIDCIAEGNPAAGYQWLKRREQQFVGIDPLQDNRFTITNGRLVLNNPDDVRGDNGEYQCRASNLLGTIVSNTVIVSFGYLNDFPKSTRDPVSVSAFQGTGIECNPPTHGYPQIYYQWLKDGNFIFTSRKPYIFISLNGKLYFSSVTRDDAGEYRCLITVPESMYSHNGGKQSQPIRLNVIESLGSERPPQIESGFPAVFPSSPKVGDNVTVECFARGYSEYIEGMIYSWRKLNGGVLPDNAELRDFNRVLYIPNIQLIHEGQYQCSVRLRQDSGTDARAVTVPVEAEPYFNVPLKNQHVDIGSTMTWRCIADGRPPVRYRWLKNGVELTNSTLPPEDRNRYTISNNVLTIEGIDSDRDPGMYQCGATNTRASRYSSAQLRVLEFAPTFLKYPVQDRIYATLRGNVTIFCQPEAAPAATKTWYKDGVLIGEGSTPSDRRYVLPNGNLRLSDLSQGDAGEYRCKAVNTIGETESAGTLTILPTTTITYAPRDSTIPVNSTGFFHCEASFNPALDITYDWYHNDYHIQFIKVRIVGEVPYIEREDYFERGTGINRGGLYIRNVQYFHKGRYTCVARTSTGSVERDAKLDVVGPPFQPVGVVIDQVTSYSVRVTWKMGPYAHNGQEVTSYIVERRHKLETEWTRARGHITGSEAADKQTTVSGLTPASTYYFRVRAENIYGVGDPSMSSDSITTGEAPPVTAPRYLGRCINKVGTLCMTWSPMPPSERNGEGFGYQIKYKKSYFIDEEWTVVNITDPEESRYVALVGQTNYYTEYDVQVRTFNRRGFGPDSQQVTIYSAMDIPSSQATQVSVWQHNGTALLVEWIPVANEREQIKGVLTGYRINYWRDCCESEELGIFNQVIGQTDHGLIIGLYPDTWYWVTVQVYNEAGYGPKTDAMKQETLRAAPLEAPQEVHVFVRGHDSIRVKFRGVSTTSREEPLVGYTIRYWRHSENRYMSMDVDAGKKTDFVVKGLEQNTMYELRTLGYSRGGDGLMSSPIIQFILGKNCYVREDSPDTDYIYKCRGETDAGLALHVSVPVALVTLITQWLFSHL